MSDDMAHRLERFLDWHEQWHRHMTATLATITTDLAVIGVRLEQIERRLRDR